MLNGAGFETFYIKTYNNEQRINYEERCVGHPFRKQK